MTYTYFLVHVWDTYEDSKESFAAYLERTDNFYPVMNDEMKKQYVDNLYKYRFVKGG